MNFFSRCALWAAALVWASMEIFLGSAVMADPGLRTVKATGDAPHSNRFTNSSSGERPAGWEFDLPAGRTGFREGTAEVSGACLDRNGDLWSIGDGGLNGQRLARTILEKNGQPARQEIYYITSYNRDMEWLVCDKENHLLIIGDTGDNNRIRGKTANSRKDYEENYLHLQTLKNSPMKPVEKRKTVAYWESKVERSWEAYKREQLTYREARIYVYHLDAAKIQQSYDGKPYLARKGFLKLRYQGGPMDVEAGVLDDEGFLYLFEKTYSYNRGIRVLKLNLQEVERHATLKTPLPFTQPSVEQILNLGPLNAPITDAAITDAKLSTQGEMLYILTERAVLRYRDWQQAAPLKRGEALPLPAPLAIWQLEAICPVEQAEGDPKLLLGSDAGNFFVSLEQWAKDVSPSSGEAIFPLTWFPFYFSSDGSPLPEFPDPLL